MTDNTTTMTTNDKKPVYEVDGVLVEPLLGYIERIERLTEEKKGISDDIKEIYSTAKSHGYDAKTMRAILKLRKLDESDRAEQEALLDIYKRALGMAE